MSRKLSKISASEMQDINSKLLSMFQQFSGSNMKMTKSQFQKWTEECKIVDKALDTTQVGLIFEKIKLGKRTEIDCERFKEAVRHIGVMKSVTYQDLVLEAMKGRALKRQSVAPAIVLGGGRPRTTVEYARNLKEAVNILELRKPNYNSSVLDIEELQGLCMQVLSESEEFIADLKPVTHRAIQALDTSMLHIMSEAIAKSKSTSYEAFAKLLVDTEQADLMTMWINSLAKTRHLKMGLAEGPADSQEQLETLQEN